MGKGGETEERKAVIREMGGGGAAAWAIVVEQRKGLDKRWRCSEKKMVRLVGQGFEKLEGNRRRGKPFGLDFVQPPHH